MTEQVEAGKETVEYMLTTVDNPFDPFTEFDQWLAMDMRFGYNTCGVLARITMQSNELSELDQFLAVQEAIDEIVRENVFGVFRKVKRGDVEKLNKAKEQSSLRDNE